MKQFFIIIIFVILFIESACQIDNSKQLNGTWVSESGYSVFNIKDNEIWNEYPLFKAKIRIFKEYMLIDSGLVHIEDDYYFESQRVSYKQIQDTLIVLNDFFYDDAIRHREIRHIRVDNFSMEQRITAGKLVRLQLPRLNNGNGNVQECIESMNNDYCIYAGPPLDSKSGTEVRIQLNDQFATVASIPEFIAEHKSPNEHHIETLPICADKDIRMGIIKDILYECIPNRVRPAIVAINEDDNITCFELIITNDSLAHKDEDLKEIHIRHEGNFWYQGNRIDIEDLYEYLEQITTGSTIQISCERGVRFNQYLGLIDAIQKIEQDKQKNNPDFFINIINTLNVDTDRISLPPPQQPILLLDDNDDVIMNPNID